MVGLLAGLAGQAQGDRPETKDLVLAGGAMAVPAYIGGVALHEGMHAVIAKLYGRTITSMSILPGRHPRNGRFYFGYVSYRPRLPAGKRTLLLLAPKLVNLLWLGGLIFVIGASLTVLPDAREKQRLAGAMALEDRAVA